MAIQDVLRRAGPYEWAESRSFPFPFKIFKVSDVVVTASRDGVESVVDASDFSVLMNDDQNNNPGGTVVLDAAVAVADRVVITSAVPYTQEMALTNQGGFYPSILNENSDRIVAQIQQLKEEVGRAIKVGVSSSVSADEYKAGIEAVANYAAASAASASAEASDARSLAASAEAASAEALSLSGAAVATADRASADSAEALVAANAANAASSAAVADASSALAVANAASADASEAKTDAQSALSTATALQEGLPQDVSDEVARQIGVELENTVVTVVREVAPQIIEETVDEDFAKKSEISEAVAGEASLRASADAALGARIDNIGDNLADVATSGSYNDLKDKPVIPENVSAFNNDVPYATKAELDEKLRFAVAEGTSEAITANFVTPMIDLEDGTLVVVQATAANITTTPSFAPNGLEAVTIVKGANKPLAVGDIEGAGYLAMLQYSANYGRWVLQNPATGINVVIPPSMPVGSTYVQFAGMAAPADLFGGTWSNISSTFAGLFFRAEGGKAASFGSSQGGGLPNITGEFSTGRADNHYTGAFSRVASGKYSSEHSASDGFFVSFKASSSDSLYGSASEVRPVNSTIRIWMRTA